MEYSAFFNEIKAGKIRPVYVFYGEEDFIKYAALKAIEESIVPESREMDLSQLYSALADEIILACETLPMFAQKRLVVAEECVSLFGGRQKSGETTKLIKYIENFPASACLVLVHRGEQEPKNALFTAIAKAGGDVKFPRLGEYETIRWIIQHARMEGGKIHEAAAKRLRERTGNDLFALSGEVKKLACYARDREITPEDIDKVASRSLEAGVFPMVEAFLGKDVQKGMEMLQTLLRQGENPQAVTGAAASRLREMLRAKLYLESGLSRQQAVAALGGNPYAAGRAVAECSRYSTKRLSSALMKLAETDFAVKTGRAQQRTGLECALIEAFGETEKKAKSQP